ncbi:hypothetical protein BURMUCF2_A0420 [Burkholderia multivorans CF2]|nr:hypothetical protein BURMUCF2_A0420 [Burkholderia multivorans CF2]
MGVAGRAGAPRYRVEMKTARRAVRRAVHDAVRGTPVRRNRVPAGRFDEYQSIP